MLTKLLWALLICAIAVPTLWVHYVVVMALDTARAAGRLSKTAEVLGAPVVGVGLVLDVLVNLLVATVLFLDVPRELLLSQRLKRLAAQSVGWRARAAVWLDEALLAPFDHTGSHID